MANIRRSICPYCDIVNNYNQDIPNKSIQTCDVEEGGCDKDYAVIIKSSTLIPVHKSSELTQTTTVVSYKLDE